VRSFNYKEVCSNLLTPEIVALLTKIYEYKGKQVMYKNAKVDVLEQLVEIAKIQSVDASNRIEGIYTSQERLRKLVKSKTMPQNRDEEEIAGYRDVLATIHVNHDYIPLKTGFILQLHRDLYNFSGKSIGGAYKVTSNTIVEEDVHGNKLVRFQPVEAWETQEAMESICNAYDKAANDQVEVLLVIPVFILDFLCIHPFNDGNGRMSRLITLLLLYRVGYDVGKYISIERIVEQSKETYYEVLLQSSKDWHEGKNDYSAFVKYTLGVILSAYRDFSARAEVLTTGNFHKPDMVRELIKGRLGKITKREIMEEYPGISQVTVQRALSDLLKNGDIIKIGGGRYTQYTWNWEKEA